MKMNDEIKQMLDENIVYLATSTKAGKPDVVPIGLAHAISDNELLIHDFMFRKTRKKLEEDPHVAIFPYRRKTMGISSPEGNRWNLYKR